MNKQLIKDGLIWGSGLWLVGYVLGIILFAVVPHDLIGWIIMPVGIAVTLFILVTKIHSSELKYYFFLGLIWAILAIVLDYFLLVKLFKPADGYYKLDVYLYYFSTLILPLLIGGYKSRHLLDRG